MICNFEREECDFKPKSNKCNICYKEYQKEYRLKNKNKSKEYHLKYYLDNKEYFLEKVKIYTKNNKEKVAKYKANHYEENKDKLSSYIKHYYIENKEHLNNLSKEYRSKNRKSINEKRNLKNKENREYIRNKEKDRRKNDPVYRIAQNIRTYIRKSFKFKGYKKTTKTEQILGCSFLNFRIHLESKFEPWMTWENYGLYNGSLNYGWDIDHITPISIAKSEEEVVMLNHYLNLQPLCSLTNRHIKRDLK